MSAAADERRFPIMANHGPRGTLQPPRSIPWAMIAPHEAQAQKNHYQTLQRLAERGGLGACEAVAVLEDRKWHRMEPEAAITRLAELLGAYAP